MHVIQYRDHTSYGELSLLTIPSNGNIYSILREDGGPIDIIHMWEIPDDAQLFRVIVAGSRDFNDYNLLRDQLDLLLQHIPYPIIISGAARGADSLGEQYARERGLPIEQYPAEWDRYKKSAGYIRNEQMAKLSNACVIFWDGKSRGTKHMQDFAIKYKLELQTVLYKETNR